MEITKDVILRAWREEEYRNSLPEETRKQIPARPTGDNGAELSDAELEQAAGGATPTAGLAAGGIVFGSGAAGYGIGAGINALVD